MGVREKSGRIAAFVVVGGLLLVAAAMADVRVAAWVHARELGPVVRGSWVGKVVKAPGDFRFTLILAGVLTVINFKHWRAAVLMAASGVMAGAFYTLVKWSAGRTRPFPRFARTVPAFELHPFPQGWEGLWKADNLAFPSGHACLAFSTAMALSMMFPRGRWWFFLAAAAVGAERVLEGAHYPSDVAGAAMLGVAATFFTSWVLGRVEEMHRRRLENRRPPGAIPGDVVGNVERGAKVIPVGNSRGSAVGH